MAINIADLEASIKLVTQPADTKSIIDSAKAINESIAKISSFKIPDSVTASTRAQRLAFKEVATSLEKTISTSANEATVLITRLHSAGAPLDVIRSLVGQTAIAIDNAAKAANVLVSRFHNASTAFAKNPFNAANGSLNFNPDKTLTPLLSDIKRAYDSINSLITSKGIASAGLSRLISDQQAAMKAAIASVNSMAGGSTNASVAGIKNLQSQLAALNLEVQKYKDNISNLQAANRVMNDQIRALEATALAQKATTVSTNAASAALNVNTQAAKANTNAIRGLAGSLTSGIPRALDYLFNMSMALRGPLGGITMQLWGVGQAVNALGVKAAATGLGISAVVGSLTKFASEAIRIERALSPARELFVAIGKLDASDGIKDFETITNIMTKYGINIEKTIKPIVRMKLAMKDTALGGQRFVSFIEDFSAIASKFALPEEAIMGMSKSIEQMVSKGRVQLEELRNQLGDRFPAAMHTALLSFREMTGKSTASMEEFLSAIRSKSGVDSIKFLDVWTRKVKEVFNINNEAADNLNIAYGKLSNTYTMMISKLDASVGFTTAWKGALNATAAVLQLVGDNSGAIGPIVAAAIGVTAVASFVKLTNFIHLTNIKALGLRKTFLLIGIAAGALAAFSYSTKEAEASTANLLRTGNELSESANRAGESFAKFSEVGQNLQESQNALEAMRGKLQQLKLELSAIENSDSIAATLQKKLVPSDNESPIDAALKSVGSILGANTKSVIDYRNEIANLESTIKKLEGNINKLSPIHEKFINDSNAAEKALKSEADGASAASSGFEDLESAITNANTKLNILKTQGLGALEKSEAIDLLVQKYGSGMETVTSDFLSKITLLQSKENELSEQRKLAESQRSKSLDYSAGDQLSKAESIIQRAQSIMDGMSTQSGDLVKKMIEDQREYQEALIATGMSYEAAAQKADQFRAALEAQSAGVNLASMQLQPLKSLQSGLDSFADSLADLFVNGQLNAKSFSDTFKKMALSVSADIVSMVIKANILRPIMQGLMGGTGSMFGMGGFGGTQPLAFAKGGIIDSPTFFGMGSSGGRSVGLAGEAGDEAILPLKRGPDGSMGVSVYGGKNGSSGSTINITFNVQATDAASIMKSESQIANMISRATSRGNRNS